MIAPANVIKDEGVNTFKGFTDAQNEHYTVRTSDTLAISQITALAVDSLYLDIPKVQAGN